MIPFPTWKLVWMVVFRPELTSNRERISFFLDIFRPVFFAARNPFILTRQKGGHKVFSHSLFLLKQDINLRFYSRVLWSKAILNLTLEIKQGVWFMISRSFRNFGLSGPMQASLCCSLVKMYVFIRSRCLRKWRCFTSWRESEMSTISKPQYCGGNYPSACSFPVLNIPHSTDGIPPQNWWHCLHSTEYPPRYWWYHPHNW